MASAKEAAEKIEKQIPRGLKPARNDKNKRLTRWPKGQHYPKTLFSAASEADSYQNFDAETPR